MPSACAAFGESGPIAFPARCMVPASAGCTPVRTLIRVDLPAPFWPITACTSPGHSRSRASCNACTPTNDLSMPCISSTGEVETERTSFTIEGRKKWPARTLRARRPVTGRERTIAARSGRLPSILAAREFLRGYLHREHAFLGDDAARQRLAGLQVLHRLHQLGPEQRAALDADVELAGDHRLERTFDRVDRDDDDVLGGFHAGFFDGLDRPDRHVVVVCVEHIDLLALGLEEGFHHFLALGAGEVAGLRADDLELLIGLDDFLEALLAVDRRRRTHRALQFNDVHLAGRTLHVLDQPAPGTAAFLDEVRTHEGDPQRIVFF